MNSRDGVTVSDATQPDNPLIFVNKAYEVMTGYSNEEAVNRNCRYLQGSHNTQRNISVIRNAINNAKDCLVTIRNYRKDGSMFWNELSISPVFDTMGKVTHFIGIQKDVTARIELEHRLGKERKALQESKAKLENLVIHDSLTGIYNRRYFETHFKESWQHLMEVDGSLTLMMIDVDYFKRYNDTYGHLAGDEALQKVASKLSTSMKRVTDFTARYGGEEFIVLAHNLTNHQAISYAHTICANVRNMCIKHANSTHGFLTISCGVSHIDLLSKTSPNLLLQQADTALYKAKANGRNQAMMF